MFLEAFALSLVAMKRSTHSKKGKQQKRAKLDSSTNLSHSNPLGMSFTALPCCLQDVILGNLDAKSLCLVSAVCKSLKWTAQRIAEDLVIKICGKELAGRWKYMRWLERLRVEETSTSYDTAVCAKGNFCLLTDSAGVLTDVKLEGLGPKLLVSDLSTAESSLLRWRFIVRGNTAFECGVVPVAMQEEPKALHKRLVPQCEGFTSTICVGSKLHIKLPVTEGAIVEVVASKGQLQILLTIPPDSTMLHRSAQRTMVTSYCGPEYAQLTLPVRSDVPLKLAATCWANSHLQLLHTTHGVSHYTAGKSLTGKSSS